MENNNSFQEVATNNTSFGKVNMAPQIPRTPPRAVKNPPNWEKITWAPKVCCLKLFFEFSTKAFFSEANYVQENKSRIIGTSSMASCVTS